MRVNDSHIIILMLFFHSTSFIVHHTPSLFVQTIFLTFYMHIGMTTTTLAKNKKSVFWNAKWSDVKWGTEYSII
jgi:hypothetical protein